MTNAAQQIVTSYETLGLSIEQIAEVESIAITAVKAILYANSSKYRSDIDTKKENGTDIDNWTLQELQDVVYEF